MLDAAEELFAIHGYNGASMRSITRKAGVNLAAIHYHLGDKQLLYEMVLCRRLTGVRACVSPSLMARTVGRLFNALGAG